MNLDDLLNFYEPPPPKPPNTYWADHVYQLHRLELPIENSYPKGWYAYCCIRKAMEILLYLKEINEESEETFTEAYTAAIPEVEAAHSRWRQTTGYICPD